MLPFSSVRMYITRKYNRMEELPLPQFSVRRLHFLLYRTSVILPAYYVWLTHFTSLYWNSLIDFILCVTHTTCLSSLYLSGSLHIMRDPHFISGVSLKPSDSLYRCPRRNVKYFGRVFLMLNYTDITQNTYIQSW